MDAKTLFALALGLIIAGQVVFDLLIVIGVVKAEVVYGGKVTTVTYKAAAIVSLLGAALLTYVTISNGPYAMKIMDTIFGP